MFEQFIQAFVYYGKALGAIFKHGLGWFFVVPLVVNALLIAGGVELSHLLSQELLDVIRPAITINDHGNFVFGIVNMFIKGALWLFNFVAFIVIFAYFGGYIVMLMLSPFYSYVSEKLEERVTGTLREFDLVKYVRAVINGLLITVRNIICELLWVVVIFIACIFLMWIPVVGAVAGLVAPVILFLIGAYFYGFSFMYYTTERHSPSLRAQVRYMRKHKGFMIGIGLVFASCVCIPFAGAVLGSFVSIVSVSATCLYLNDNREIESEIR